jgi:prepilin-type N-terminal cleavage/methylation domain-containing protein
VIAARQYLENFCHSGADVSGVRHLKSRQKRRKRTAFTLLELLLCLLILSLIGGALSFPLKGMLEHHRLRHNVKAVALQFKKAQALALNYQTDMGIRFYEHEKQLYCQGFTDEPIIPSPFQLLKLDGVSVLIFNDLKVSEKQPLQFKIFATGRIEPKGSLIFQKNGEETIEIDLAKRVPMRS